MLCHLDPHRSVDLNCQCSPPGPSELSALTLALACFLLLFQDEIDPALLALLQQQQARKERKPKKLTPEQADAKRRKIWVSIAKKEIPKVDFKLVSDVYV